MAKELQTIDLTAKEDARFEDEFDTLCNISLPERDLREPYLKNKAYIKYGLTAAKNDPGGEFFGRGARGGQLGWGIGRAQVVRSVSASYNWQKTWTATGWQDHMGTSSALVYINEDCLIVAVGMANFDPSPKLTMVKPVVMGDELNIENMCLAMLRGTRVQTFLQPWIVTPKEGFYMRGYVQVAAADEPALLFVEFAKASYLQKEAATTQSGGT